LWRSSRRRGERRREQGGAYEAEVATIGHCDGVSRTSRLERANRVPRGYQYLHQAFSFGEGKDPMRARNVVGASTRRDRRTARGIVVVASRLFERDFPQSGC
jgi:hypothetical protein